MTDETDKPEADTEGEDKARRGRPPKETPETVMTYVRIMKTLTKADGSKTPRGKVERVTLAHARHLVKRKIAEWTDPRPDLA